MRTLLFFTLFFIITSVSTHASFSKFCKYTEKKTDQRWLDENELKVDKIYSTVEVQITNRGPWNIKNIKIIYIKPYGTIEHTFERSITIKPLDSRVFNMAGYNVQLISKVLVKGPPYLNCKTYYTNLEWKIIRENKKKAKEQLKKDENEKIKQRKLKLEKRKREALERSKKEERLRKLKAERNAKETIERKKEEKRLRKLEAKRKKVRERQEKLLSKLEAIENKHNNYLKIKQTIIYENCIIDKLDPSSTKELEKVIISNCERISKKSNRWEKFWYDKYDEPEPPKRALINVQTRELLKQDLDRIGLKNTKGVIITNITKNGAADKAGVLMNDVILKINDVLISSNLELMETTVALNPGKNVPIQIFRDGKTLNLKIIMGSKDIPN